MAAKHNPTGTLRSTMHTSNQQDLDGSSILLSAVSPTEFVIILEGDILPREIIKSIEESPGAVFDPERRYWRLPYSSYPHVYDQVSVWKESGLRIIQYMPVAITRGAEQTPPLVPASAPAPALALTSAPGAKPKPTGERGNGGRGMQGGPGMHQGGRGVRHMQSMPLNMQQHGVLGGAGGTAPQHLPPGGGGGRGWGSPGMPGSPPWAAPAPNVTGVWSQVGSVLHSFHPQQGQGVNIVEWLKFHGARQGDPRARASFQAAAQQQKQARKQQHREQVALAGPTSGTNGQFAEKGQRTMVPQSGPGPAAGSPTKQHPTASTASAVAHAEQGSCSRYVAHAGQWSCSRCTLLNVAVALVCEACKTTRGLL